MSVFELQVLLLLSQGKTLTDIADQLLTKHPTISRALHTAERKAGVTLAEHTGRRLRLTSAGMDVAAAARSALSAYQDVDRLTAGIRSGEAGSIRVISTRTAGGSILPEVLARFLADYPAATLTLQVAEPMEVWAHFVDDGCDVGVGAGPAPSVGGVRVEWLYDERMALFVRPDSPLAHADLSGEIVIPTLIAPDARAHDPRVLAALSRHGVRVSRRVDIRSQEAATQLVEAGVGVGLLDEITLRGRVAEGRVAMIRSVDIPVVTSWWMACRQLSQPLRLVERFATMLREHVATLPRPVSDAEESIDSRA